MTSNVQHDNTQTHREGRSWQSLRSGLVVFLCAFLVRVAGAVVTTLTTLNPDSTADAVRFGNTAQAISRGILEGQLYLHTSGSVNLSSILDPLSSVQIYPFWGTFLAPFWLLPGPSSFYARLGNAFLGAYAIYNVYLIARYYHSHQAGVITALPLIFYPSIVAIHTTILREAIILGGVTTAARLLMLPQQKQSRLVTYGVAGGLIYVAFLLRKDNLVIYAAALAAALTVHAVESEYLSKRLLGIGIGLSPVAFVLSLPIIRNGIEYLGYIRSVRAFGRTVYLPDVIPQTVGELVAFSWVGAAYFLYAPFPWMIEAIPDLLVGIEGIVSIGFTVGAIWGVRFLGKKNSPVTAGLLAGLAVAVVLYGVGTANYGTGMRHRQMFFWVIFLFGGIGFSEHVRFEWPFN